MKAVINNGITYKVTTEKGSYTYTEDVKGKVKCFLTSEIEVVEIEEMPKAKVFKKIAKKVNTTPHRPWDSLTQDEKDAFNERMAKKAYESISW